MGGVISGEEPDKKDLPYPAKYRSFLTCAADPICLGLFGATVAFWLALAFDAFTSNHTPMMLLTGQDFKGDYCGTGDYKDFEYVFYTLDPNSPCLEWEAHPVQEKDGTAGADDWMANNVWNSDGVTSDKLHRECKKMIRVTSNGNLVDQMVDLLDDRDSLFNKVCVKECPDFAPKHDSDPAVGGSLQNSDFSNLAFRTFYPLRNGTRYRSNWELPGDAYEGAAYAYPYVWGALPEEFCPYEEHRCASPWNHRLTVELENGYYCMPTPAQTVADLLAASPDDFTQNAAASVVSNSFSDIASEVEQGFKDFAADCVKCWPMFLYVFGIAVVVGLAWMIVLRFSLDIWIWVGIVAFGILMAAGGFFMMYKAGECVYSGEDAVDTADQLQDATQSAEAAEEAALAAADNLAQAWNGCPDDGRHDWAITDDTVRNMLKYGACVIWGIAGIYILCVLCSIKAIYMGVRVTKCAARFVFHNRMILMVPIVQIAFLAVCMSAWIVAQLFLFVDPAEPTVLSEADSLNRATAVHKCWTEGLQGVYCQSAQDFQLVGSDDTTTLVGNSCIWACVPPAVSMASWKFWWGVFAGFWIICLIIATCQMIIAFACSIWFFKKNEDPWNWGCQTGFWWTVRYHLGTLCFGSVIVAALKTFKAWITYQQAMVKATTGGGESPANKVMETLCCAGQCCLWCIEKCIKFLNKNAYIYVALKGEAFCTAAKNVFTLIVSNVKRVAWLTMISGMVVALSVGAITAAVVVSGHVLLLELYPKEHDGMTDKEKKTAVTSAVGPTILFGVIGYIVAKLYMTVYAMATSTILVCAIEAETLDIKHTRFDEDEDLGQIYAQAKEDSQGDSAKVQPVHSPQ